MLNAGSRARTFHHVLIKSRRQSLRRLQLLVPSGSLQRVPAALEVIWVRRAYIAITERTATNRTEDVVSGRHREKPGQSGLAGKWVWFREALVSCIQSPFGSARSGHIPWGMRSNICSNPLTLTDDASRPGVSCFFLETTARMNIFPIDTIGPKTAQSRRHDFLPRLLCEPPPEFEPVEPQTTFLGILNKISRDSSNKVPFLQNSCLLTRPVCEFELKVSCEFVGCLPVVFRRGSPAMTPKAEQS